MHAAVEPDDFISFASEDRPYAELVKGYLLGRDRSVWSDEEIGPGENWEDQITRSLEASRAVILRVASVPSLTSQSVRSWCRTGEGAAEGRQGHPDRDWRR